MVSGVPLSDREKAYIKNQKDEKFPKEIAEDLERKFPLDNCGKRSFWTVKEFLQKQ